MDHSPGVAVLPACPSPAWLAALAFSYSHILQWDEQQGLLWEQLDMTLLSMCSANNREGTNHCFPICFSTNPFELQNFQHYY